MEKDEKSKQKILMAATKLFAKKGFDSVSVREICKEANLKLCLISYYFGGKQDLYNAIIEDLIAKQNPKWSIKMPVLDYLRSLIGAVFNLEKDSRELVYQTLFIISQVNSPKIFQHFSEEC